MVSARMTLIQHEITRSSTGEHGMHHITGNKVLLKGYNIFDISDLIFQGGKGKG